MSQLRLSEIINSYIRHFCSGHYLRECGALDVLDRLELLGELLALLGGDGPLLVLRELLDHLHVVAQVHLCADEQERRLRAVVRDLRDPLKS